MNAQGASTNGHGRLEACMSDSGTACDSGLSIMPSTLSRHKASRIPLSSIIRSQQNGAWPGLDPPLS